MWILLEWLPDEVEIPFVASGVWEVVGHTPHEELVTEFLDDFDGEDNPDRKAVSTD